MKKQKAQYRKQTKTLIKSGFWGNEYETKTEWVPCNVLGKTAYYRTYLVSGPSEVRDKHLTTAYLIEVDGEKFTADQEDVMLPLD